MPRPTARFRASWCSPPNTRSRAARTCRTRRGEPLPWSGFGPGGDLDARFLNRHHRGMYKPACLALPLLTSLISFGGAVDEPMDTGMVTLTDMGEEETTQNNTDNTTLPTEEEGTDTNCGNGVVEAGEQCDLGGNNSPSGQCTPECLIAACGDG